MSDEKLGKLRAKLKEITELIEEADQKKTDAKHETVEAIARLERLEVELQSGKRRIQLIKKDLEDNSARLSVAEEKLGKSTSSSDDVEANRQELEQKESEDDEAIQNLEENIKEMKRTLELNELKVVEGERKRTVCQNDIARLKEKADTFEARVKVLEETIESHGNSLQELETKEGECGDREALNEEKVDFLEGELKETEVRAEAAERNCAVLRNNMLETESEINNWIQKREEIENQMILMDDVADDPAYAGLGGSDGASRPTTPSTMKERTSMFNKPREKEDDEASVSSKASSKPAETPVAATPEPESASESAPASEAEESEVEESDVESVPPTPEPPSEAESVKASEPEQTEDDEESEEESSDDDW